MIKPHSQSKTKHNKANFNTQDDQLHNPLDLVTITYEELVWKDLIAPLWYLSDDGPHEIKVKGQLCKSEKGDRQASCCIQWICHISQLMFEDKDMPCAE